MISDWIFPSKRIAAGDPLSSEGGIRSSMQASRAHTRAGVWIACFGLLALASSPAPSEEYTPTTPREVMTKLRIEGIEDRVRIELDTAGGNLTGAQIEVAADAEGLVTLSGVVGSEAAQERAARLARYQVGVQGVDNQLRIDTTIAPEPEPTDLASGAPESKDSTEELADEDLARRVAQMLASSVFADARADEGWLGGWRVEGDDWKFDVEADEGDVHLEGAVATAADIERALESVREIPGVRQASADLEALDQSKEDKGFFDLFF